MTLILIQNQNNLYTRAQNKLSLTDNFLKHRSISLLTKKEKDSLSYEKKYSSNNNIINNSSIIQVPNRFQINNIYTHKNKKHSNIDESVLPIVSIDLDESSTLKKEEICNFNNKISELTSEKIKLLKLNYIKELANLRDCIDKTLEKVEKKNS